MANLAGIAFRKKVRANLRKQRARKMATAGRPRPSPQFAKNVLAVVNRKEETKYVAQQLAVADVPDTLIVPTNLQACIPDLLQGTKSSERIGQKVSGVNGRVDFTFVLNPGTTSENTASHDVYVRIFLIRSKSVKDSSKISSLTNDTLLDNGNQNSIDWKSAPDALFYEKMPLSKEDFVGRHKTIHLRKNFGLANGGTESSVLTYGQIGARCSYRWSHKSNLLYDDKGNVPTNFAPLFAYVAYNVDGSTYNGQVQVFTRLHMWYKDA